MRTNLPQTMKRAPGQRGESDLAARELPRRRERGILIIECLVYLGVVFVVLGLAYMTFYRCQDFSIGLRRNGDDIMRALNAGELWRQDIRSARGQIKLETTGSEETLRIPQERGDVAYRLAGGELRRCAGETAPWVMVLPQVKTSHMQSDVRTHVTSWRWEIELGLSRRNARVRPLFTFQAVPPNSTAP